MVSHKSERKKRKIFLRPIYWLLLVLFLNIQYVKAEAKIEIATTEFKEAPQSLFYFRESDVILYLESESNNVYRSDNEGKTWNLLKDISKKEITTIYRHPYDNDKAIIATSGKEHYLTQDQGKTWKSFEAPVLPASKSSTFLFNSKKPEYIIYLGSKCEHSGFLGSVETCKDSAYYTTNFFKSSPKKLLDNISTCKWVLSSEGKEMEDIDEKMVVCIKASDKKAPDAKEAIDASKLVWSTDFFNTKNLVDFDFDGVPDGGVIGFTVLQSFMVAAVRRDVGSEKLSLFVSKDAKVWAEGYLPKHKSLEQNAFTLLDSTSNSIVLDVVFSSNDEVGGLYFSNSNGTYFTQSLLNVNRDSTGIVDFERVKGVENIILSNIVQNPKEVSKGLKIVKKKLASYITFNNGGQWDTLIPPNKNCKGEEYSCLKSKDKKQCSLHLHSVSNINNMGPVFSRQSAPGILLGVGNVGPYLKDREDGDTFYSKDGGLSWKCARPGPHKYVLGDMGSILVLAEDKKEVKRIIYSFDQGQHWNEKKLNAAITPVYLTTEKLSSSQSVILLGEKKDDSYVLYHFDFSKAHPRKCKFDEKRLEDSKDFEVWQPKSKIRNNNNKQDKLCIMGSELKYFRRKPEVECYIGEKFKIFKSSKEKCPCTESDFECDYNYILNEDGKCELHGEILIPKGECKKKSDKFMASSGYRKIPGNNCDEKAKGAVKLNQKIEKSCNITDNTITIPNNGKVRHQRKEFSHSILNYYIFPKSEVYMIYTINGELWTSLDKGTSWRKKIDEKVIKIIGHPYDKLTAFVITKDQNIYLTKDQGKTFDKFSLPLSMSTFNTNQILSFNSNKKETILFIGSTECPKCHSEAFISNDYGKTWKSISKYVRNCEFGITSEFTPENKNLIFCSIYNNMDINIDQSKLELVKDPNHPLDLYTIDSQDITKKNVILKDIGQFTISGIYLIASSYKKEQLLIKVAKSNLKFSDAKFPPMMEISSDGFIIHESENSDGSSIMLTLSKVSFENTTTPTFGISQLPIGSLFTSNFDGTAYSLSLPDLRVSSKGIVDLEQVLGIQGMILANQVTSMDENKNPIAKTVISYDNGATWNYIQPPKKGINGKEYDCLELGCSLHLHTIYENHQQLGSFGNQNSKGHMIAVGNVGQTLLPYEECQTYLTLDNGITWNEIKASESLYAIGDSGSILVLVDDEAPTNTLIYSLDGGKNWNKYIFSNDPIKPTHLLTASSGESLRFLIIGFSSEHDNSKASAGHKSQIVTVDFSELFERKCEFDELKWKDFEKWTPERIVSYKDNKATTSKCLLGSKLSLWRKKIGTNCYVGENSHSKEINMESCECNEQDYECDVNYWRSEMGFGECLLFGKDPDRPKDCKRGEKYKAKSGYRKIATSHCKGGKDLSQSIEKECLDFNGIDMKQTTFDSEMAENFYFRESFTIVIRTNDGEVHISKNEGYSFHKLIDKEHDKIISAMHHTYIDNTAYFVTLSNTHYYTHDETLTINSFKTPTEPNGFSIPFFSFHPEEPSWAIFTGTKGCDKNPSDSCRAEAYLTKDNGATWKSLGDYVRNCQFAKTKHLTNVPKERILCETYKDRSGSQSMFVSNPVLLKYSDDDFETSKTLFENIIGFSFFYEFMVVAESDPDFKGNLILNVSKDVEHFEHGRFPLNLTIASDGFTVLESNTHSLFLHITSPGQGYGPLLISDSNGTQFTKSLDNLNRDDDGFVDFEKMAGIEGVALANQVFNSEEVKLTKIKKIQSRITFNNGATWERLTVRGKDSKGEVFNCKGPECGLHLHSFTERSDPENIFSIPAAVGMMVGVGNFGKELGEYANGNTFFTNNAGKHWSEIAKGPHRHEFGDSGGVIMLVKDGDAIDELLYSKDMGLSFQTLKFPKDFEKVRVLETSIEPQSTSLKFLILGHSNKKQFVVTHVDFSGLQDRKCIEDNDSNKSDFETWSPSTVRGTKCFFGHELTYYRRKRERKCFIGRKFMDPITEENVCECTDLDYECDFNFQKDKNGRCVLISGKDATKTLCENGISSYNISSGYRKIAMSQCKGGKDLSLPKEVWCPGHGLSGMGIFFIILIPLIGLIALLYGFIIRGSNRRGMDWKRIYYVLSPYLCFLPALIVELIYGQGSHGLRQRLFGNRGGYRRGYEYEPVAQYDYDYELDDEFIDGPAEIELNEEEEDDYQDFVGATTDNNINIDNNNLEINFDEDEEDGLL